MSATERVSQGLEDNFRRYRTALRYTMPFLRSKHFSVEGQLVFRRLFVLPGVLTSCSQSG